MPALFFGDSRFPKLGFLTAPPGTAKQGVLLCGPLGHEAIRSQWAMRQVAHTLTKAGYATLRFDYRGQGDSGGDTELTSVDRLVEDITEAHLELRDAAGVRHISIVGLRVGAALAACAVRDGARVRQFVWWDPVVDGDAFLRELDALHEAMLDDEMRFRFSIRRHVRRRFPALIKAREQSLPGERLGFIYSSKLLEGLATLRAPVDLPKVRGHILLYSGAGSQRVVDGLERELRGGRVSPVACAVSPNAAWSDLAEIENAFLPGSASTTIVRMLDASASRASAEERS